jgi:hypothetical protein
MAKMTTGNKIIGFFQKLPGRLAIFGHLLKLFSLQPIDAEALRGTVR